MQSNIQYLQWWQDLAQWQADDLPIILMTVLRADGSTPREIGASMLCRQDGNGQIQLSDTIGGGHLELQAIEIAKQQLDDTDTSPIRLQRFNLAASLGQCCGGVMWLLFERISSPMQSMLQSCFNDWKNGQTIIRHISARQSSTWQVSTQSLSNAALHFSQNDDSWSCEQTIPPFRLNVLIFGAGHVGEAIVRCLLPVGAKITWVDVRDDIFPEDLYVQVDCICTDIPEMEMRRFDRSGAVLILTHDHQLDLQLCLAALKSTEQPFKYVGMIGSKSKRAIFEKRMRTRGYDENTLQQLVCPIGITGIVSKQPAMIAVAVVAQLLQSFNV